MPKYSEYLLLVLLVWMVPDIAYAQNSVASVLCKVGSYIWGPVGSVIAMLGVVAIGLIAMFGKIQISSVLTVMVGISLVFGAQGILNNMGIEVSCAAGESASVIVQSEFYAILGCVLSWFVGPIGKVIATLSLILIGLFATYGRISWHQALLVAVGITTMFGSMTIVQSMGVPVYSKSGAVGSIDLTSLCVGTTTNGLVILSLEKVFCTVFNWFNGPIAKGAVTVGIIIIGLGAMFGKVSWGLAIIFAVGVALIFGGNGIMYALGGPDSANTQICTVGKLDYLNGNTITKGTETIINRAP